MTDLLSAPVMSIINNSADLSSLAARLAHAPFITVDTEFMRERTYYPVLCLIQVASEQEAAIIDPLAPGLDLKPFLDLLVNEQVLKVFHAARQDIEIFYHLLGAVPAPVFDTQIAAMACGLGDQVGYEALVRETAGIQIDKGSRFTDWSRRPLSDRQLDYALGDVTHLVPAYHHLCERLTATRRWGWVEEEMQAMLDPRLYHTTPDAAWERLKTSHLRRRELGVLMRIAAWREREAQERDVPRARILKDDVLYEVARAAPGSPAELASLRAVPSGFDRSRSAEKLLAAVAEGVALAREEVPERVIRESRASPPPDVLDLLRVLLKCKSEEHGVAPKLLCSAADLEAIAVDDNAPVPALSGWRRDVFGEAALRLKRGEIALSLLGRKVSVLEQSAQGWTRIERQ